MATTNTVKMTFTYADNKSRNYEFSCAADDLIDVEYKINAINASISAGTDDGFKQFFISDDGAMTTKISTAQIISVTETVLDLGGNS